MTVAVAIPVYKPALDDLERLSLTQCVTVLGKYPLVFFGPRSLDTRSHTRIAPAATKRDFDDAHFVSLQSYSNLLLSPMFYEAFADFDHVLIHQLDAFVFYDALETWCSSPYDYIGAPLRDDADSGWLCVGNGGFSLRNVRACLAVLTSEQKEDLGAYWEMERLVTPSRLKLALKSYRRLRKLLGWRDDIHSFLTRFMAQGRPEDKFWALHASRFDRRFRVASVDAALQFAIEGGLMEALSRYAVRPPFGCHRNRFLQMISRYLAGVREPKSEYEAAVWAMAERAGLAPLSVSQE